MAIKQHIITSFNESVPHLEEQRKELHKIRKKITEYFTREKLSQMSLDDYCLGRAKDFKNLSYSLEYLLDGLGRIGGRPGGSSLFGVWYSVEDGIYKVSRSYKKNFNTHIKAFNQIKRDIVDLYDSGKKRDIEAIFNNSLDDWFKGKFLATYFPDQYLNVYSRDKLEDYARYLGAKVDYYNAIYLREALIKWKNETPIVKDWSLDIFGCFLWHLNDIIYEDDNSAEEDVTDKNSISNDDRMAIYRDFLKNCIQSNSVDNNSQFSQIDKWVKTKYPDFQGVISIDKEKDAQKLYDELNSWPKMPDDKKPHETFKQIGGGQYHNAVLMYIRFLHAIELCAQLSEFRARSGNDKVKVISYDKYLAALRTKPFLLLAGISGTGKSRIVRELAYKCCPDEGDLRADKTTPGNYLMVEVKPNWHDSSELLGYYSNISKKYILTPFVRFLVKAKKYPDVPFFVCLDEMNLAPVELYFAEFLSILETRRKTTKGVKSGVLVEAKNLTELGEIEDLTLPDNVFIIGTVNMDDTTHQFSRKVIDRAMTIEMNGGKLEDMFGHSSDLEYTDNVWTMSKELKVNYVSADEVTLAHQMWADNIKTVLPAKLEEINRCLKGTPFEVSYRVLNELVIYLGVLLDDETEVDEAKFAELVDKAVDQILLMKILPRIEGDSEMFYLNKEDRKLINNDEIIDKLQWLENVCPDIQCADGSMTSKKKIREMSDRLNSGFTRYWP